MLLDVMMPEMDGFETCAKLKAAMPDVPVVLLTALDDGQYVRRGLEVQADEFVTKPARGVELRARVRSMLRIRRHYQALSDLLSLRKDLVHMVVHDMRSPLTTISLMSLMLLESPELGPEVREDLRSIERAAARVEHLASDMLVMARMEEGHMRLRRAVVDAESLVQQALDIVRPRALTSNILLVAEVARGTSLDVDSELFVRVLDNLISNAIKFSPRASTVVLRCGPTADGRRVHVSVSDQGVGVPLEDRARIFQKFGVVQRADARVAQLGLGLTFCSMVVAAHGGSIRVDSNAPCGSVFTIEIDAPTKARAT